jgi:hypothetical protein
MKPKDAREGRRGRGDSLPAAERSSVDLPADLSERAENPGSRGETRAGSLGMDCADARRLLHRYIEDELGPIHTQLLDRHISQCPACREERDELERERLWLLESALGAPELSESFAEKVVSRIRATRRRDRTERRIGLLFRISGVAAAVLALTVASLQYTEDKPRVDRGTDVAATLPNVEGSPETAPLPYEVFEDLNRRWRVEEPGSGPDPRRPSRLPVALASQAAHPLVNEAVVLAVALGDARTVWRPEVGKDPCRPDPNKDGKVDWTDVTYSCQVQILTAESPPESIATSDESTPDPECVSICL